jgi:hypothetical protein
MEAKTGHANKDRSNCGARGVGRLQGIELKVESYIFGRSWARIGHDPGEALGTGLVIANQTSRLFVQQAAKH